MCPPDPVRAADVHALRAADRATARAGGPGRQAPDGSPLVALVGQDRAVEVVRQEAGGYAGDRWARWHAARVRVVRGLRRAGYIARARWALDAEGRYVDGPCAGLVAVDPWIMARHIAACAASWRLRLTLTGSAEAGPGLGVRPSADRCRRVGTCPVCSALVARDHAGPLMGLALGGVASGPLALVTLTQRARAGEALRGAMERLRAGMDLLMLGRSRSWSLPWRARVAGWRWSREVTRGADGRWWHVHAHVLAELHAGEDHVEAAAAIGAAWSAASAEAAARAGLPRRWGWDPAAGQGPGGGWWRPVTATGGPIQRGTDEEAAVRQAAKYACPAVADLDPVHLAEWVTATAGAHWCGTGGAWRAAGEREGALAEGAREWEAIRAEEAADEERRLGRAAPEWGERVSAPDPHADPRAVVEAGIPTRAPSCASAWRLDPRAAPELLAAAIDAAGEVGGWTSGRESVRLTLPPDEVARSLAAWRADWADWAARRRAAVEALRGRAGPVGDAE